MSKVAWKLEIGNWELGCYKRFVIRAFPPYGSNVIKTRSPTSTFIRCIRIFPDKNASFTSLLESSSTRNKVSGNASVTVPYTPSVLSVDVIIALVFPMLAYFRDESQAFGYFKGFYTPKDEFNQFPTECNTSL